MSPVARGRRSVLLLSSLIALAAPATSQAATITLLSAVAGGGPPVLAGGGVTQNADKVVVAGGYEAHARTTALLNGALSGGVSARTNDADQLAVASAHVESTWDCPTGNCLTDRPIAQAPLLVRVAFDGIVDPLMLTDPTATATEEASLEILFQYQFPGGSFEFRACYEAGTPFDRAESGCANFFEASFTDTTGQRSLTDRLVFGPGNTVSFDWALPWNVQSNEWIDSYDIRATVDSTNSNFPHALNFLNTFTVQQTSLDPGISFNTGGGLTTAAPVADGQVPEPATLLLVGAGLAAVARRRTGGWS